MNRTRFVRVALLEGQDPKVFDAQTGEDVTADCREIVIQPLQTAYAVLLVRNENGNFLIDRDIDDVQHYRACVVSIRAEGIWTFREV